MGNSLKITVNALAAANSVMIPMQCEYYALEGLTGLLETIEKIRKHLNPDLKIEGLLRTMYDPSNNLATQVSAQLIDHFGEKVYRTIIPRNVRLAEAPSHGLTALKYDKSSRVYRYLKKEFNNFVEDEGVDATLRKINVNRKMILLKVDTE